MEANKHRVAGEVKFYAKDRGVQMRRVKCHSLHCPNCGWRLIDVRNNTVSRTYIPDDPEYPNADFYQKCPHCKGEVGIQKVG